MEAVIVLGPAVASAATREPKEQIGRAASEHELRSSYRKVCGDIDRLLAEGRLPEARRLNDEARTLFRRLYGSSVGSDHAAVANRSLVLA